MGAFIISPLPPVLAKTCCAARLLRSTGITPLLRYSEPNRHRLAVGRFPGVAGYTAYPAPPIFSMGRGRFLQLLDMPLPPRCPYHPAGATCRLGQPASCHAAFAPKQ